MQRLCVRQDGVRVCGNQPHFPHPVFIFGDFVRSDGKIDGILLAGRLNIVAVHVSKQAFLCVNEAYPFGLLRHENQRIHRNRANDVLRRIVRLRKQPRRSDRHLVYGIGLRARRQADAKRQYQRKHKGSHAHSNSHFCPSFSRTSFVSPCMAKPSFGINIIDAYRVQFVPAERFRRTTFANTPPRFVPTARHGTDFAGAGIAERTVVQEIGTILRSRNLRTILALNSVRSTDMSPRELEKS